MSGDAQMIRELAELTRKVEYLRTLEYQRWVGPTDAAWVGTAGAPLTSTEWDSDAYSTTAKTLIDLSVKFGVPAGVKAVEVRYTVLDSGSAANDTYLILSWDNTAGEGIPISPYPVNSRANRGAVIVPCNASGDIYYQISASGASTFVIILEIVGYLL